MLYACNVDVLFRTHPWYVESNVIVFKFNWGNVLFITLQIASTQVFLYTSVQAHMINHNVVCNKDKYCPLTNIIILSKSDITETHRVCVNVDICHADLIQIRLTFIYQC